MPKGRLEAFTDAIIAIVMTVLVLNLREPISGDFSALFDEWRRIVIYMVSFLMLAIYWNNHHHLLQAARTVNGKVLWANNLFILSLSIFPFVTSWMGDYYYDLAPQISFGIMVLIADLMFFAVAYNLHHAAKANKNVAVFSVAIVNFGSLLARTLWPWYWVCLSCPNLCLSLTHLCW